MPGHVAQRRVLAASLVQRPERLALEIDDRPVLALADGQRLAEVEVAVVPELHEADEPAETGGVDPRRRAVRETSAQGTGGRLDLALDARGPRRHVGSA